MPAEQKELSEAHWRELYYFSHADTRRAYEAYTSYYLSTSGQRYWSDTGQLSVYIDDYHAELDRRLGASHKGTEMISELYVPRPALPAFLAAVRADFRQHDVRLIYGTIRLIERDDESFLAWAREPWACVVVNLHVEHTRRGVEDAAVAFRRLIDLSLKRSGSFYLTYHRWTTARQLLAAYPQLPAFLDAKRAHDPDGLLQSDWYRWLCSTVELEEAA
jgi:FAD/FMN-containing dehydrogenase